MTEVMFSSVIGSKITISAFVLCTVVSIVLGAVIAVAHCYKCRYTSSFVITLALIPVISQTVIMMVNGSIGAGVCVAGAFSLIRFRSIPGTAKEIGSLFLAITVGIATGRGYIGVAVCCAVVVVALNIIYTFLFSKKSCSCDKLLKITLPEDFDYEGVFDDLLEKYTAKYELISIKTVHMGSLFQLEYSIKLKNNVCQKELIDNIRCRNANLDVVCCRLTQPLDVM